MTPVEYQHPNYLPDQLTPRTPEQAAREILAAAESQTGRAVSREALAILIMQSALETANWRSIHCFNYGNSKSSLQWPHTYFRCGEYIDGRWQMFDPPHPQTRFRAFTRALEGAEHHLRVVSTGRYAAAYELALQGDREGFARGLHAAGYYTAPVEQYVRGMAARAGEIDALTLAEAALRESDYDREIGWKGDP